MAAPAVSANTKHGLPPVLARHTRVVIFGSFPGEASLAAQQYYAHPQNQFWRLLGAVLEEPLSDLRYGQRLAVLKRRGIGLWDVLTRCEREGSSDGAIRKAQGSDFALVRRRCPELALVCFNGQTAGRAAQAWEALGVNTLQLPSSSPAYTRPFADKLAAWQALRDFLDRDVPGDKRPQASASVGNSY